MRDPVDRMLMYNPGKQNCKPTEYHWRCYMRTILTGNTTQDSKPLWDAFYACLHSVPPLFCRGKSFPSLHGLVEDKTCITDWYQNVTWNNVLLWSSPIKLNMNVQWCIKKCNKHGCLYDWVLEIAWGSDSRCSMVGVGTRQRRQICCRKFYPQPY